MSSLDKKIKYVMPAEASIDIDNIIDFKYADFLIGNNFS
jgi:CMP-N-acetylneuraminic acid synthetase